MFKRQRTIINGVELPADFQVGNIINNVVFSADGTQYAAVTRTKGLVIDQVPENGRITVDGNTIICKRPSSRGGVHVYADGDIYSSHISVANGSITVGTGSTLENELDKSYSGVSKIVLREKSNDIRLSFSEDNSTWVKGFVREQPNFQNGELSLNSLEGRIYIPNTKGIMVDLKTMSGDIKGKVASAGKINTMSGDITLNLYAPLILEARTMSGDVRVKDMKRDGRRYLPQDVEPQGTLQLETMAGDIKVKYNPQ